MGELPDMLSEAVGDAAVLDTIDVGGGDTIAVTDETTYIYRSDGLLKDESVESFDHAVERLSIRTKRRKSSIRLETIDTEESFTVPSKIADEVLEAMIRGIFRTKGVIEPDESVSALFRFSELTLVVTDRRLFEHIGSAVWDEDFETVAYANLSGLDFERGSVATQVILETRDRRRRVKVPNEHAGTVRRTIQEAVFGFHDVASLEELRAELSDPVADEQDSAPDFDVDAASEEGTTSDETEDGAADTEDSFVSAGWSPSDDQQSAGGASDGGSLEADRSTDPTPEVAVDAADNGGGPTRSELEALSERVETLSRQLEHQTELIESQQELIEQLVDELRRGR
jgi:hypothetical protein